MPELSSTTLFVLRANLREQLLRAAEALADERVLDADALALTRNTAAAVLQAVDAVDLQAVDTVDRPALVPAA